ncbi:hypothetical protein B0H99_103105 [Planomicrobium soli]|uniref:Ig-like protein group 3 n=1 Tax=Planomicrobium soli TaxID=1176648 RepID=A0A2P8H442_9BACL|nr:Ig-like domain-containing protein [Planomicrobium soli]PSL40973.1 hypothetical protein B0H99_103105 [Planomicrobium soli]
MYKILRKLTVITAFVLASQWFFFMESTAAYSFPILSKTEFSETTRNMDLTNRLEVFPTPIYLPDPATGELVPTLAGERGGYPLYQAFVSESSPSENFSAAQKLDVGTSDSEQNITFLKFGNRLPDINGGLIHKAELNLFEIDNPFHGGYWDPAYINRNYSIHKVLTEWSGDSVTWMNRPQISEPYTLETMYIKEGGSRYEWDVTKIVGEWYQNPKADFGLAVTGKEGIPATYRSFYTSKGYSNKTYDQLDRAPRLLIDYSPRPSFNSGYGRGLKLNSGENYIDLAWFTQSGVKGYKLSIFNGKEYETIDIGMTSKWTSFNKNIWPTAEEIENGAYQLKLDGTGTNLSSNPGLLYENAGNTEKNSRSYYFKLTAYNEFGESAPSDEFRVSVPNRIALEKVSNVVVAEASPERVKVEWDGLQDAIKYRVRMGSTPGDFDLSHGETTENEIVLTSRFPTFFKGSKIYISVEAVDKEGNYSGHTTPISAVIRKKYDAHHASTFSTSSVNGDGIMTMRFKNLGSEAWTLEKGYELKLVSENALLAVDSLLPEEVIEPDDIKMFRINYSGKQPIGEIQLKWQMYHRDSGFFGEIYSHNVSFYDEIKPVVNIQSPNSSALLYKTVEVKGTAKDDRLKEYKLFYGSGSEPSSWNLISSGTDPVENGLLGNWDIRELASGTYTLKLEAIDEGNNVSTQTREVKVNLPLGQVNVAKVTDQSVTVTGSGDQNNLTAFISIQKGSQVLGSDVIDRAGFFSIPIAKQPIGTVLTLHLKNEFGVTLKEMSITVKDGTPPLAPKVNTVADNSTQVNGTAEIGSTVIVSKETVVIGSMDKTNSDGTFAVNIAKQPAGTKLQVVAKDAEGNVSAPTTVTVIDKTPPPVPVVNSITDNSTSISGKAEKNSTVTIKIGSVVLKSTTADTGGGYSVAIPIQKAGTVINVTAKDAAGNVSAPATKTVLDKTPPNMPSVSIIGDNSTSVKGRTEKNAIVTAKRGSTVLGTAKATADGTFAVPIQKQKAGTYITVTARDAAGNTSFASTNKVFDKTPPSVPTVNKVYSYSKSLSGKTEPYATVSVKKGKTVIGTAKASSTGTFTVKIKPQAKRTVLTVTAKDAAGNSSKAASVTVR